MNKFINILTKTFTLVVFGLFLTTSIALAQAPGSGGPQPKDEDGNGENPPPTGVPIDGGATLLLAAGAGYGLKKLRDNYKAKEDKAS